MKKWKELRQTTTVDEYLDSFDAIINGLNLSEFDIVSCLLGGVKKDHLIGGPKKDHQHWIYYDAYTCQFSYSMVDWFYHSRNENTFRGIIRGTVGWEIDWIFNRNPPSYI